MKTVVGSVRVSSAGQVDGAGLGLQRDRIHGWRAYQSRTLVETFEDAGISGSTTDNRPALKAAMRSVLKLGSGGALLIDRLDRLGRNAIDVQETLAVLLDAGVRVVSLGEGRDSASGMGAALLKLLVGILATFAELDRDNMRTRLLESRRRADTENRTCTSEPRYSRLVGDDNKTLHPDPAEVALVERVRELRATGISLQRICNQLALEGHRPRRALKWSATVVRRIATGLRAPKKSVKTKRIERARAEPMEAPAAPSAP